MQNVVAFVMASVILVCPLLCRADAVACCDDHAQTSSDEHSRPEPPSNDSSDCGSCICDGAVKDLSLRGKELTASSLYPTPDLLAVFLLPELFDLSALGRRCGRTPPDWLAWLSAQRVHSLLQNFRC